ncbi:hypothetical protein PAXRUDRAFT_153818 [Paxillus rubicundulus Ve08.2h10]|uniref:Unplaced genomic scaffold scaffold_809, whole genome shotgun sequence n=1 Tax=Paxillus rubicundulus Ve08.2h10 TaxID=930991 RepID=A0A0D0CI94_9AGAM|nr:hypothetical protein PAXRUDRAFT_153818 [Paxillus rubicundulus Ve08.2h10]
MLYEVLGSPDPPSSILADIEIESYPHVTYPSLDDFLLNLETAEPARRWYSTFRRPLMSMGVRSIDDLEIVSPDSLFVFHQLCPLMIMDFYVHILDLLDVLHGNVSATESQDSSESTAGVVVVEPKASVEKDVFFAIY